MPHLPENNKTGDFDPQRTLSGSFFVIPERLESTRAVVLAFTVNKQTNTLNYIYRLPVITPTYTLPHCVMLYAAR